MITGAADDDPSGVATYSTAGAQFGSALLWTAIFTWPLMTAVQLMCARVGMVTGRGLADALRDKFPRPVLMIAAVALLAANTVNVGSDLAGMADAAQLLTGITSHVWVILFGGAIAFATIRLRHANFAAVLKWLALILLVYIATALYVRPDWSGVLHDTITIRERHDAHASVRHIRGTVPHCTQRVTLGAFEYAADNSREPHGEGAPEGNAQRTSGR